MYRLVECNEGEKFWHERDLTLFDRLFLNIRLLHKIALSCPKKSLSLHAVRSLKAFSVGLWFGITRHNLMKMISFAL